MARWEVWRETMRGGWRRVRPSYVRRKDKTVKEPAARRIARSLRARGIRAGVRPKAIPLWVEWVTGDVDVPRGVPRKARKNFERVRDKLAVAAQIRQRRIEITSGVRSYAQQKELYETKPPGMAARPGTSFHETGLAADCRDAASKESVGDNTQWVKALTAAGLHCPLNGEGGRPLEPWHVTEAGVWG